MGVTSPKAKQPLQGMDNTKKKTKQRDTDKDESHITD